MYRIGNPEGPYAAAAFDYRRAGWAGVVPVGRGPAQKSPPPVGYTGYAGIDPSGADIQAWIDGPQGAYNIGLHVPAGVYVLDVDATDKPGAWSLRTLAGQHGQLPATWTSTSRGSAAESRHYFFRANLPEGRVWLDHPGKALDSLHVGHRYAVVWPSVHPSGETYLWYDPTGVVYEGIPKLDELAELPAAWVEALSKPGEPLEGSAASDDETRATIQRMRRSSACPPVARALASELQRMEAAQGGLHAPGPLYALASYGIEGHGGVPHALALHCEAYVSARCTLRGESEASARSDWWRMVRGAVGKRLMLSGGAILSECECSDASMLAGSTEAMLRERAPEAQSTEQGEAEHAPSLIEQLRNALVDAAGLDGIPEPEPVIPGVLYKNSLAWIYGLPGCGKSFTTIDMAGSVGTGESWQGFGRADEGNVLYLVAEGLSGLKRRVRAWEQAAGQKMRNVHFLPVAVQATNAAQWGALCVLAAEVQARLIIVDTQARVTVGMEENSAKEMGQFVERCEQLRLITGACVLIVHHTGRGGEHLRGSIAMEGAATTTIQVVKDETNLRLKCTKQKDAEPFDDINLRMVPTGDSVILAISDGRSTSAGALTAWRRQLTEWWDLFSDEWISPSKLVKPLGGRTEAVFAESTFIRVKRDLIDLGAVERRSTGPSGRYSEYRLVKCPAI